MRADLTDSDIHDLWRVADRLADRARLETLAHFRRRDLGVESKAVAFDPVTEADRACEAAMRDILTEMRPDDGILGEEGKGSVAAHQLPCVQCGAHLASLQSFPFTPPPPPVG